MRLSWLGSAVLMVAALLSGAALAGMRMAVPGSAISLDVPDGFSVASGFSGFEDRSTGSSIHVVEFPDASFAEIAPVFFSTDSANAAFGAEGVVITATESLKAGERDVKVLRGSQQVGDVTVEKWVALVGPGPTAIVTFSLVGAGLDEDTIRASLASIEVGAAPSLADQLAVLPYTLVPKAPFVTLTTLGGSAIGLTISEVTDPEGTDPIVLLGWQVGGGPATNAAALAEPQLRQTVGLADAVIDTTLPTQFAGAVGVKIGGTVERAGITLRFVQYLAVLDGQSVRLLSTMPADEAETLMPVVEAIAQSVRRQ